MFLEERKTLLSLQFRIGHIGGDLTVSLFIHRALRSLVTEIAGSCLGRLRRLRRLGDNIFLLTTLLDTHTVLIESLPRNKRNIRGGGNIDIHHSKIHLQIDIVDVNDAIGFAFHNLYS